MSPVLLSDVCVDVTRFRFCRATKRHPYEAMKAGKASIFKAYLHWRTKHSRIKKESSIMTYWNVLSMVYAEKTCQYMDGGVLYDVGNVCSPVDCRAVSSRL